jgi:prevent-host-death family protein
MFVRGSNHKGAIAELKIATAATELGIDVLRPMAEHGRYDLGFELGRRILRVQCKWGGLDRKAGVIKVNLTSSWLLPSGYVRTTYQAGELDLVAVYCGDLDRCYLLDAVAIVGRRSIWLRLSPPKNQQRACINLAADYEFAGAVAQLEERRAGSAQVGGSSPPSSIPSGGLAAVVGAHQFRNHFGFYMERAAAGEEVLVTRRGRPTVRLSPAQEPLPLAA